MKHVISNGFSFFIFRLSTPFAGMLVQMKLCHKNLVIKLTWNDNYLQHLFKFPGMIKMSHCHKMTQETDATENKALHSDGIVHGLNETIHILNAFLITVITTERP